MERTVTWKVGGAQGEGIDSTGDIVLGTLHRLGYYAYSYRHFMSLIKGGHTNYKIRVGTHVLRHLGDGTDVLIAFDQDTIDANWRELSAQSLLIHDAIFSPRLPDGLQARVCKVPLTELAKSVGGVIMKNNVAVGVTAAIWNLSAQEFRPAIQDRFGKKGDEIIEANLRAVQAGYDFFASEYGHRIALPPLAVDDQPRLLMSGNEAVGFGALMAGCRFLAAYPITPATEIMYWALANLPKVGGVVVQAEDEIAAVHMAIGANYAGVRAMTSTSGPGFSLMQEALGISGISEIPLVVVDVQRGGPSTGLPTKTEQSDLQEALFGSHGEIPRIVLAPATVEEAFYLTAEAFNLAETYQCPVIVLSDLLLGMSKQTIPTLDFERIRVERGRLLTDAQLTDLPKGTFKRYELTDDGLSPRSRPGQKNGRFVALSNEHDENSLEIEDQDLRERMFQKRMRKMQPLIEDAGGFDYVGPADPALLLVGFGSTYGPLQEARLALEAQGSSVGHLHLRRLWPFPRGCRDILSGAREIVAVELNYTGQLQRLLQQELPLHDKLRGIHKYNGDPLFVQDVMAGIAEPASVQEVR